ncbi:hypothetical protein JDV02_002059 [Purpureocillium takamizusanense]|uniref:Protein kinase domain-containing protein n=1 Tax=Purpureocillium takamizusanense TaxID=2060973 RepID=A0A9Q8Q8H7_9HYPO|nr:uncharacterized protein JDV02_002059 [Purpureocillium takamizusanense]UNI15533.1 hypothetical protein JDV02_002059 [Purpureocillium takamizusanense]
MGRLPQYDLTVWQIHETEDDCDFVIRTNNGRAFYCTILPSDFHESPQVTQQYFRCLHLLRSGEEEIDDFYMDDALEWLADAFRPLVLQQASIPLTLPRGRPTLSEYLFPVSHDCRLAASHDELRPFTVHHEDHGCKGRLVALDSSLIDSLEQWTQSYNPSDVEICYDHPDDDLILIKPPTKVVVGAQDHQVTCFFKRFNTSFGKRGAAKELESLRAIAMAELPPDALVCRLQGVVRTEDGAAGMLFTWIKKKEVLSRSLAEEASAELRRRWADQITYTLKQLHERGIIWGDAKAANVLIDENDDAWIIDFGGSYTVGWVDKDKAGTLEGDMQGLARIMDTLS